MSPSRVGCIWRSRLSLQRLCRYRCVLKGLGLLGDPRKKNCPSPASCSDSTPLHFLLPVVELQSSESLLFTVTPEQASPSTNKYKQEAVLKATAVRSPLRRRLCHKFFLVHQFFLVLLVFHQSCCPQGGLVGEGDPAGGPVGGGWWEVRGLGEGEGAGDISATLPYTALPHGASP